jgi:hypothetical protein
MKIILCVVIKDKDTALSNVYLHLFCLLFFFFFLLLLLLLLVVVVVKAAAAVVVILALLVVEIERVIPLWSLMTRNLCRCNVSPRYYKVGLRYYANLGLGYQA